MVVIWHFLYPLNIVRVMRFGEIEIYYKNHLFLNFNLRMYNIAALIVKDLILISY